MRAILVCVDYADLLAITLPYNRHHFDDVMVVTTPKDDDTAWVAERNNAIVFKTNAFYEQGELFNKWRALELGLDLFGREGWLTIMDADVMWPKEISDYGFDAMTEGYLYSPFRKLWSNVTKRAPAESEWSELPTVLDFEHAGYSQTFHCGDRRLPEPPWHETDWIHAGGADSAFQNLWPPSRKVRPPWFCLHLGPVATNWAGRVSPRVDGSLPSQSARRHSALAELLAARRVNRSYSAEKLPGEPL